MKSSISVSLSTLARLGFHVLLVMFSNLKLSRSELEMKEKNCEKYRSVIVYVYIYGTTLTQHVAYTDGELFWFLCFCRWGLSRHFHYVPEILAAFFWTLPALFNHVCLVLFLLPKD